MDKLFQVLSQSAEAREDRYFKATEFLRARIGAGWLELWELDTSRDRSVLRFVCSTSANGSEARAPRAGVTEVELQPREALDPAVMGRRIGQRAGATFAVAGLRHFGKIQGLLIGPDAKLESEFVPLSMLSQFLYIDHLERQVSSRQQVFDALQESVWTVSASGVIVQINDRLCEALNVSRSRILGTPFRAWILGGGSDAVIDEIASTPIPSDLLLSAADGSERVFRVRAFPQTDLDGALVQTVWTGLDLTDERVGLRSLENQKQLFESVVQNIPIMLSMFDPDGALTWTNKTWEREFGYTLKEAQSAHFMSEIFETTEELQACEEFMQNSAPEWKTFQIRTRKGERQYQLWRNERLPSGHLISIGQNTTEQVASRNQIEQLMYALEEGALVLMSDDRGRIVYANDRLCETAGRKREEMLGHHVLDVLPTSLDANGLHEMYESLSIGKVWRGELHGKRFDSEMFWLSSVIVPFRAPSGEITRHIAILFDITREKQAVAQAVHASKLSSLGEMAAGVAHEINNPLAIIMGKSDQLIRRIDRGQYEAPRFLEDLKKISSTSERIAKIVRGLKTFSRAGDQDPFEEVRLAPLVDDALELSRERFKNHGVELTVSCDPESAIDCRPVQVGQVLINLLNNALDAVMDLPSPWVKFEVTTRTQGDQSHVVLSVTDSGAGIPAAVAEKIMLPFFTTKEVGKGTGLGLSISRGIIEEHGGVIYVDRSSPNTRFVIELPLARSAQQKASA